MNLTTLFTDIANSIRKKKETTSLINALDFAREIESIETGMPINGGVEVTALAKKDIHKGDLLALTDAIGGFEAVETIAFPTTAKQLFGSMALSGEVIKLDEEGKVIICKSVNTTTISSSTAYYFYVFVLVDGVYQQMKYTGVYTYLGGEGAFAASTTYDKETNNLIWTTSNSVYVMHMDFEALNITLLYKPTDTTIQTGYTGTLKARGCHFADKNNFIIRAYSTYDYAYMYKYNPNTNTLTFIGDVSTLIGKGSSSYSTRIFDTTIKGNTAYMCIYSKYGTGTSYRYGYVLVVKFIYDESSGQYVYQNKVEVTGSCITTSGYDTKIHMNYDATLVMYQHYNTNQLQAYTVDPVTMTKAEMPLTFSDGLDTTKLNGFAMVRGTNFLYVLSTDTTNYSNAELLRLYEYDPSAAVYNFVCCPAISFTPATAANVLPQYRNLIDGAYTPIQKNDGTYSMYRVGHVAAEYDKTAEPCKNELVSNASSYGIATEDIANGNIGQLVMILKN